MDLDEVPLRKVSSFMYDEEPRFPFKATQNAAHIQYSRRGLSYIMSQRCSLKNISRAGAIIELVSGVEPPDCMTLDVPDANAGKIGCVRWGGNSAVHRNDKISIRLRFLKLLTERQLASVLAHSKLVDNDRSLSFFT
ncbi:hypothetical protein [Hoeflea sp.]|uniref:hypothetical protein n=1 Tax=Hoeflea sp. TaxID=1940281 RepID=UPI0019B03CD0|nr:hypothetical protein [Hoeflea sp.]MBC7283996.1 hypothetical protein [Hoeflea sp.]